MPKKTLRVALIGCGTNMYKAHLPRLQADGAVVVAAVADPVPTAAQRVAGALGGDVKQYDDWRRLLREVDVDGVVISTPHHLHYAQARAALAGDRHVLVEKPLTISAARTKRLIDFAEQAGRLLVVAYQRHHMAAYVYARELIRNGRIGAVRGVTGSISQSWFDVGGWRHDRDAAGGGMFMDTGSHLVASALWVTGLRPRRVTATVDNGGWPVDANVVVQIGFGDGVYGTLSSFGEAGRHDEWLAISGSAGSLVLHMHQWQFRSMLLDDEPVTAPARVRASTPDADFFAWMRNGGKGYELPRYAHDVARLTEAVYRSAQRRAPVRLGR